MDKDSVLPFSKGTVLQKQYTYLLKGTTRDNTLFHCISLSEFYFRVTQFKIAYKLLCNLSKLYVRMLVCGISDLFQLYFSQVSLIFFLTYLWTRDNFNVKFVGKA